MAMTENEQDAKEFSYYCGIHHEVYRHRTWCPVCEIDYEFEREKMSRNQDASEGIRHCPDCDRDLELADVEEQDVLECPVCKKWTRPGWDELHEPLTIDL